MWFTGFTTARATQGPTPGGREKFISYSNWEWNLSLKSFWHKSYQIFESCLQREDTPPREPEIYEASLHGLRQHDSAEVSITVQDYENMNMVRSILNSSLVKLVIFLSITKHSCLSFDFAFKNNSFRNTKDSYQQSITLPIVCTIFYWISCEFCFTWISQEVFTCKEDNTKYWRKIHPNYVWVLFFFDIHMKNVMNFLWGAIALVIIYNL